MGVYLDVCKYLGVWKHSKYIIFVLRTSLSVFISFLSHLKGWSILGVNLVIELLCWEVNQGLRSFNSVPTSFLTPVYSTMVGKNVHIYMWKFLGNTLSLDIFIHIHLSSQNFLPNFYHHPPGIGKLLIPLGSVFPKIFFPKKQKGVEETTICFIKIQPENMKMTCNIRLFIFFMICNFFKCIDFYSFANNISILY